MENEGLRCDKCRWWLEDKDAFGSGEKQGECRRNPPQRSAIRKKRTDPGFYGWDFPMTLEADFCGEFTPKDSESLDEAYSRMAQAARDVGRLQKKRTR